MSFATVEDLETYLGVEAGSLNAEQAQLMLDIATSAISDECGQTIALEEDDSIQLRGSWGRELWLPQRPIVAITSIAIDGIGIDSALYKFDVEGRVTWYRGSWASIGNLAELDVAGSYWGGDEILIDVTYSHGYDPIPDNVRGVCLDMARRAVRTPDAGAIIQESIGSYSVAYSRDAASTITPGEKRRLRRYKRRIYNVPIGQS